MKSNSPHPVTLTQIATGAWVRSGMHYGRLIDAVRATHRDIRRLNGATPVFTYAPCTPAGRREVQRLEANREES